MVAAASACRPGVPTINLEPTRAHAAERLGPEVPVYRSLIESASGPAGPRPGVAHSHLTLVTRPGRDVRLTLQRHLRARFDGFGMRGMRVWGLATPQGSGKHNGLESSYVDDARSNHVVGFAETPRSLLAIDLPTLPLHTDPAARPRVPAVRWSLGSETRRTSARKPSAPPEHLLFARGVHHRTMD